MTDTITKPDESRFNAAKVAQAVKARLHPGRLITVEGSHKLHAVEGVSPPPKGAVALRNGQHATPVDDAAFDAAIDAALAEHNLTADESGRQMVVNTLAGIVGRQQPADYIPEVNEQGFRVL